MARLYASGSSQYSEIDSAVVTTPPYTFSGWIYPLALSQYYAMLSVVDKDADDDYTWLGTRGAGSFAEIAFEGTVGVRIAITTNTYTANAWNHIVGIITSTAHRRCVLNGDWANSGVSTANSANIALDRTSIGRIGTATPSTYVNGRVGEVAIHGTALLQAQVEAMYHAGPVGVSPDLVLKPKALWRLLRNDNDLYGGYHMTAYNAPTWAPHPPMIYPSRPQTVVVSKSRFRLDPTGDAGTNEWTPSAGSDHFAVVDDGLREPTDPASGDNLNQAGSGLDGDPAEELSYETSSMAGGSANLITIWLWGFNTGVLTGMDSLEVAINTGGGFGTPVQIATPIEERWHRAAFAGTFNQAAIDALVVQYTISNIGGGSQSYDFTMDQTYAEVTYTAGAVGGVVIFRRRMEAA